MERILHRLQTDTRSLPITTCSADPALCTRYEEWIIEKPGVTASSSLPPLRLREPQVSLNARFLNSNRQLQQIIPLRALAVQTRCSPRATVNRLLLRADDDNNVQSLEGDHYLPCYFWSLFSWEDQGVWHARMPLRHTGICVCVYGYILIYS